jgi:multiple sugar transport system substrate-binding protein
MQQLNRRRFLSMSAIALGATTLAACAPKVIRETVVVEKQVEKIVEQTVVVKEAVQVEKEVTRVVEKEAPAQPKSQGPWKVTVMYGRGEFSEVEQKLCEEKYPSLKIEFLETDYTRFTAMVAAGNPPDYVRSIGLEMPYMVTRGVWLDMTPYMDASAKLKWDDLHPIHDLNRYQGGFYGIVKDWSPDFSMWYNLDMFAAAGVDLPPRDKAVSLEYLREASAKLNKKEGDRTLQFGADFGLNSRAIAKVLVPLGKSYFAADNTKIDLQGSEEAKALIKFMVEWAKEKTITSPINPGPEGGAANFSNGISAMVNQGYWFSGRLENAKSKVNAQMYPAWSFIGDVEYNPCGYGCSGSITRKSKVADGAWLFNEYFMFEEPAHTRAKNGWGVPGFLSHFEMMPREGAFRGPLYELIMKQVKVALPAIPVNPYIKLSTFDQPYSKYLELHLKGEITFDEFMAKIEEEVNMAITDSIKRLA